MTIWRKSFKLALNRRNTKMHDVVSYVLPYLFYGRKNFDPGIDFFYLFCFLN